MTESNLLSPERFELLRDLATKQSVELTKEFVTYLSKAGKFTEYEIPMSYFTSFRVLSALESELDSGFNTFNINEKYTSALNRLNLTDVEYNCFINVLFGLTVSKLFVDKTDN